MTFWGVLQSCVCWMPCASAQIYSLYYVKVLPLWVWLVRSFPLTPRMSVRYLYPRYPNAQRWLKRTGHLETVPSAQSKVRGGSDPKWLDSVFLGKIALGQWHHRLANLTKVYVVTPLIWRLQKRTCAKANSTYSSSSRQVHWTPRLLTGPFSCQSDMKWPDAYTGSTMHPCTCPCRFDMQTLGSYAADEW